MTKSILGLNFTKIRNNWELLKKKVDSNNSIRIENLLRAEDSMTIQKQNQKYRIRIQIDLKIDNEFSLMQLASKVILLKHLGFVKEYNVPESISNTTFKFSYIKIFTNIRDVIESINKINTKYLGFKATIELKQNALMIFIENSLATLYPYQHEIIQPKQRKVKEIVDSLIDAFVQDRNYSSCVNTSLIEVEWGVRTARQIANLINNTPEIVYRVLRNNRLRAELLKFVEIVPYKGPGRRVSGENTGRAFRIKMENPYIVEKLKEMGIPLNVIFPGG
ncbi:MAG: hypothetical protein ACTSRS_18730 [Candidatus Helarchaeota archaeon]